MSAAELFEKLLKENRIIMMMWTKEDEQTFAAYKVCDDAMYVTLTELQKQAKEKQMVVALDLSLMTVDDFEQVNPQESLEQ